ncbi:Ms4533A family Cys-rich leader peptide [Mycolicibacter longobardus]|nr:Ms4533A family Cys-rich leader peptide [Mycolicibacter longobardus]
MFAATGDRPRHVVALPMLAVVTSAVADLHCCC